MENKKVVGALNDLLIYLHDSRNGFRESAELMKDSGLRNLFESLNTQRQAMITQLQGKVRALESTPVERGSFLAAAHRAYLDLKSLLTGGDKQAIIDEIHRGEETLISAYHEILKQDLPADIEAILQEQLNSIKENLHRVERVALA